MRVVHLPWVLIIALGCAPAPVARDLPCYRLRVEHQVLCAALAITDDEVRQGLMGRRTIGPDEGMLFVYARPGRMQFWMKNTPLDLDIGYFDAAGILREIYPLAPLDETPVVSRSDRIRFALEVPRGWFAQRGLTPGARLDLALVDAALAERGANVSVQSPTGPANGGIGPPQPSSSSLPPMPQESSE
jgi:uncharacterized membrane protein (UPF0127 family)